jgi:hypothetical protein
LGKSLKASAAVVVVVFFNRKLSTVRNAAGFPGDQTVGLPTLVQNPLTANDIANPTGLDRRFFIVWVGVTKQNKIGLAVIQPNR